MKITQTYIARHVGVSIAFINQLVNCKKRPNWEMAKKLATVTKTNPVLWLEGTTEQINKALGA